MSTVFEIVADKLGVEERWPVVVSSNADDDTVARWIAVSADPVAGGVRIFESRDSETPLTSISGSRNERTITGSDGSSVGTVSTSRSKNLVRTLWNVEVSQGDETYTLTERTFDGVWRRLIRPLPQSFSNDGAPDLLAAVLLFPFLAILRVKPWCRLIIRDNAGLEQGFVEFASDAKRPREHFTLHMLADREANQEHILLPAAVAAISVMH